MPILPLAKEYCIRWNQKFLLRRSIVLILSFEMKRLLCLYYFIFDVGAKFSRDVLEKDDFDGLLVKLRSCYPGEGDDCKVSISSKLQCQRFHWTKILFQICSNPLRQDKNLLFENFTQSSTTDTWITSCPSPEMCLSGNRTSNPAYSDLPKFIGEQPVAALDSICDCEHNNEYAAAIKGFGPDCTWRMPPHDHCVNGEINQGNFMTGCECRHPNGTIRPYHGWYCEVPNSVLCKENRFYDLTEEMTKVGDEAPCKSCRRIIPGCEICEENNCEFIKLFICQQK